MEFGTGFGDLSCFGFGWSFEGFWVKFLVGFACKYGDLGLFERFRVLAHFKVFGGAVGGRCG